MKLRNFFMILLLCTVVGVFGVSCTGDDGPPGPQGEQGPQGPPGPGAENPVAPEDDECDQVVTGMAEFTGSSGSDVLCGDDGENTIEGADGDDTILGRGGGDKLYGDGTPGTDGEDTLYGGAGDDTLDGGDDSDMLYGEEGNDTLIGGEGDDLLDGGPGSDTADYSSIPAGMGVDVTLGSGGEVNDGQGDEDMLVSIENVIGGPGTNTLVGDDNDNKLTGGPAADTIDGGKGDDVINGGGGTDTKLAGGEGSDTYVVADTDSATLNEDGSIKGVSGSSGFENLAGGENLTGNSKDNVLDGGQGSNTLQGDPSPSTAGNDIFVVWKRSEEKSTETDTINDFQKPGLDGEVKDVIHLKGFSAKAMAEDDDDNEKNLVIKDGSVTQTITFGKGSSVAGDDIDEMVGDGRGSNLLIFMD